MASLTTVCVDPSGTTTERTAKMQQVWRRAGEPVPGVSDPVGARLTVHCGAAARVSR